MKGYVQLRRGIAEHFKIMSSSELKVYVGLLLLANYKTATVNITIAKLSDFVALSYKMTQISLHRLEAFGYVKYTQARNQWQDNKIEITKYNGSVKTSEPIAEPIAEPTTTPIAEPVTGANDITPNNNNNLQNPKKYKEVLRNKYTYLKEEGFNETYENYLEMRIKIKKPATDRAQDLVLKKLHEYDLKTAVAMLEQSIISSWQGVFPIKGGFKNGTDKNNNRKGSEYFGIETEIKI